MASVGLRAQKSGSVAEAFSYLSQYFTILTNAVVLALMLWIALGRTVAARWIKPAAIAIVCVGLVYHTLLAHLVALSGIAQLAGHGIHTFVPLLALIWWAVWAPKPLLKGADVPLWVLWPPLYCAYILIRAQFSGFYPYPFLNVPVIGWDGLAIAVAGLMVAFIAVGLALTALGRLTAQRA